MRHTHVGGGKLFVDFAGDTVPMADPATGVTAVLPARVRNRRFFSLGELNIAIRDVVVIMNPNAGLIRACQECGYRIDKVAESRCDLVKELEEGDEQLGT